MKRPLALLFALYLTGTVGACGLTQKTADGPTPSNLEEARVAVTNNNWLDMSIYAVSGGQRVRLGMVNTMGTENFLIPLSLISSASTMHLVARPIGATGSYSTEPVSIWPGETVQLTIQNLVSTSTVTKQ